MTNPMTRRRFFQALAASAVVAGVSLPVGFPSYIIGPLSVNAGEIKRWEGMKWLAAEPSDLVDLWFTSEHPASSSMMTS